MVLTVACALAIVGLLAPAADAAPPAITLNKEAPETALLGTNQKVTLVAHNPAGQPRGYNLTIRDVLPQGVAYVAGSAGENAPQVLENKPGVGMTTLIFENVADLSPNSDFTIGYEVEPSKSFFKFVGGKAPVYTNEAEAFISEKPRLKPTFDANGEPIADVAIGVTADEATTELTAIEVEKEEPSPEGEILRGLHEHQRLYTLTVRNNKVGATRGIAEAAGPGTHPFVVEDWLPAGLEFLGCGAVDNTTQTLTNPGSTEEYPGSGPIDPGNAPPAPLCEEPFFVQTEEVDPPGKQPFGVYTHVKFLGPEELAPGGKFQLQYVAAIPILKNTTTWLGAEPPTGSLTQIANLDNNTGEETVDEEDITNTAQAEGEYESTRVKALDELHRTAEDLAIQKTTDQPEISAGALSTWSLHIEASEYRRVEPVSIVDTLPDGLCPLGPKNYEAEQGTQPTEPACAASTEHPTVRYLKGGGKAAGSEEAIEYTLAEEQAAGGYKLEFDAPGVAALQRLEPSQELLLTFPTATQTFYQENFHPSTPVLTGDSWTNHVETSGPDYARCYLETGGKVTADPNCETKGALSIFHNEIDGEPDTDVSEASQEAGGIKIEKTVRENNGGLVPVECKGETSEYVKGLVSKEEPVLPQYRPGDQICWRLVVKFASALYAGTPVVSDFIPPGETYVPKSQFPGPANTVTAEFNEAAAKGEEQLEWTITELGEKTVSAGQVFEYRFKTEVTSTPQTAPGEITGNLMKFSYSNSEGETFPLRDRAEVQREEPNLTLEKGITEVEGERVFGAPAESEVVHGGEKVTFVLNLKNTGSLDAEDAEVWDVLPAGIECADVILPESKVPPLGECDAATNTIKFTGIEVAAGGGVTPLTYEVVVPSDVAPNHTFENVAGVTQFKSETNTEAGQFEYFPKNNIDPALEPKANSEEIRDHAQILTTQASLKKSATTAITPPGNDADKATIGEIVNYKVTAVVPPNSILYGSPTLTDELPAGVKLVPGSAAATLDGGELEEGLKLEPLPNGAAVQFPIQYPAAPGAEHTVVLTFQAQVLDIPANKAGVTITNEAAFEFQEKEGARTETLHRSAGTPIVEPHLVVNKKNLLPPAAEDKVSPGDKVEYETEVTNTGASTAYETLVTDIVPTGMRIADEGEGTPGGVPVGRKIEWHIPTIAPGATAHLRYSLEVEKPAPAASHFTNVAVAQTQSLPDVGGVSPAETRTAESEEAAKAGYEAQDSDTIGLVGATVSKEVDKAEGTVGTELTYTLHMTLRPEIEYFNTTMVDQLPKGVSYDRFLGSECSGEKCASAPGLTTQPGPGGTTLLGAYFGNFEAVPGTRVLTVKFEAHIDGGAVKGPLTNTLAGFYNEEDEGEPTELPVPGTGSTLFKEETAPAQATTKMVEPELALTKTVSGGSGPGGNLAVPGGTYEYTVTVENLGDGPAYDFYVEDNPSANLTGFELGAVEGATVASAVSGAGEAPKWHVAGPLPAGGKLAFHYTATLVGSELLKTGDTAENLAEVPAYFGLEPKEREGATEFIDYPPVSDKAELEVELPSLELEKTVGTPAGAEAEAEIGKPVLWHITVTNTATAAGLKEVSIVDTLPKGWEYVEGSTTGLTTANPTATVNGTGEEELAWGGIGLAAGASKTLNFEAVPTLALALEPGPNVNDAVASGEDLSGSAKGGGVAYEDSGSATANLKTPGLTITKTPDVPLPGSEAVAGKPASYSIAITNAGEAVATEVEVTDLLGKGNEYAAGSATANPPAGFSETAVEPVGEGETQAKWLIASIPSGGTVTITVPVSLSPSIPDKTKLVDTATVKSAQETTPVPDEGSLMVERETDVLIEKQESRSTLNAGEDLTYTLHVENLGPSDATGVVATDALPSNVKVLSAPGCTEAAGLLTCEVGDLALGSSKDFTVEVQVLPSATGTVVNEADVTSTTKDEEPANNHSEQTATLTTEAALTLHKSGPSAPVLLGSTFVYTLEVENTGPSDAQAVKVEDELPAEVEAVSVESDTPSCAPAAPIVECELGTMIPGQKATIHVTVKAIEIPTSGEPVKNTATVSSPTDPTTPESSAETTVLPAADLAIVKTAPATVEPNGDLTYKLHVENLGPSPAHGVAVHDPLPAGVELIEAGAGCAGAAGVVTCVPPPGGELAVGEGVDFQITVHVPFALGGQSLVNTAEVAAEEADPKVENNTSTATTTVGPAADLSITKTMGKAQAGQPLTYTLAVTNHGPSDSSAVTVTDTLPAGTTFKSAAPSQGTCTAAGQTVTCQLGPLAAGASAQVSIIVDVAETVTGSLRNVAKVEGPEPDPDTSNNESAVEGPVDPPVPHAPNLKVVKTADTSAPAVGKPFEYDVAVTDVSGGEAKNVRVLDTLNGPVKVLSIKSEAGTCKAGGSKITCEIPSIPVGRTVHITYSVVAESAGPLSNTASAQASNGEVAPSNNHAVKSVKARNPKGTFSLTKTASRKVVPGGKKVGFTIELRNGALALTGAKICDRLPDALVFAKAAGARFVNGEACWTKKYVAPHRVLKLHLVARAVKGYKSRRAENVATANAANAKRRSAAATVRIKPAFAGKPGGVTG